MQASFLNETIVNRDKTGDNLRLKGVRKRQLTSFGEFGLAADGFVNLEWSVLWPQFKWCCCWSLEGCEGLHGSLEGIRRRLNRLEMGLEGL